jgi:hypothetical protein
LRVERYDQVASMLVALLIMVGMAVLLMFIVWLTGQLSFSKTPIPVELLEYAGRGDHAEGLERDEEIGLEELEEIYEPQVEASLEAITDVVSTQAAAFDAIASAASASSTGVGLGDSRGPGPLGEGSSDVIPEWERWEIRYTTEGLDAYARQLDFFKIELGAMGGGSPVVEYASNLASPRPTRRSGDPDEEKRMYMSWKGGGILADFDKQLLRKAGIDPQRRLVLQFYPVETRKMLLQLEAENGRDEGHTDAREFLRTIFGVRSAGSGYEFFVIDQFYRPAPAL